LAHLKCAPNFQDPKNLKALPNQSAHFLEIWAHLKNCAFSKQSKKAQFLSCADQKSAHFLGAPKSAPNLPEVNGAPYGFDGAPLYSVTFLLKGRNTVFWG
jgi:hypothetical protein